MAVIKRGILGGVQNKIGNVVGSSWKGIATLRSLPLSVANPKTAAQTQVRGKFSAASQMASSILATIIKPLWDRFAQQESGYNAWIRANIDFFTGSGEAYIDSFVMSKGSLAASPVTSATYDISAKTLAINWTAAPAGDANPNDQAYVTIIGQDSEAVPAAFGFSEQALRSAGTKTINVDLGDYVESPFVYLSFRKADGTKVSDSFAFEVNVQA